MDHDKDFWDGFKIALLIFSFLAFLVTVAVSASRTHENIFKCEKAGAPLDECTRVFLKD